MLSFRAFINERLAAAAEEIFGAVEKTIIEYKEEICRSKDLEISRLRIQLKLLKSDSPLDKSFAAQLEARSHHHLHQPPPQQEQQHHHQSFPADDAPESQQCDDDDDDDDGVEEEEEGSSVHPEHPRPSLVKKEQQKSHDDFWMDHSDEHEQLENLESDIKDFMPSPSSLRSGLQDPTLSFHASYSNNSSNGEESREKPYCCSVCEKRFNNSCHLAAHIRTHTGERPYRCEICRKTFITTSALNRHQTIHTEGKHFICNYCGKTFKWMESLSRHVRSVHKRQSLSSQ